MLTVKACREEGLKVWLTRRNPLKKMFEVCRAGPAAFMQAATKQGAD